MSLPNKEPMRYRLENFGPIRDADVTFGDLTLMIGPQGTGKSLFLQMFKLELDAQLVLASKRTSGYIWPRSVDELLGIYFNWNQTGISTIDTKVNSAPISVPADNGMGLSSEFENVNYIPSNRDKVLNDGYFVQRSQQRLMYILEHLHGFVSGFQFVYFNQNSRKFQFKDKDQLFWPANSIYYGLEPTFIEEDNRLRFGLSGEGKSLDYRLWSFGQGSYFPIAITFEQLKRYVLDSGHIHESIKHRYIVIEEPELGLHPKAIQDFMLQVFGMMQLGFKIILSTHSDYILETVWVLKQLQEQKVSFQALEHLFQTENRPEFKVVFEALTDKSYRTYFFKKEDDGVHAKDISSLDLLSEEDDISDWGGFMNFKERANAVVAFANSAN
jgi:hypothetical protein